MVAINDEVVSVLKDVAQKHPSFESFLQDMERIADHVWHNMRADGDAADEKVDEGASALESDIYGDKPAEGVTAAPPASTGVSAPGSPATPSAEGQTTVSETRTPEELGVHTTDDGSTKK